jgi:hypothetical protein
MSRASLPKLYASFDVESDGGNASQNSMLSLGICFILGDGKIIDEVEYHMFARKDRTYEPRCMSEFWMRPEQKLAWEHVHQGRISPQEAIMDLAQRLAFLQQSYTVEWIAYPSCFDWMFVKSYYDEYGPENRPELGYYCTDIGSEMRSIARAMNKSAAEVTNYFKPHNPQPHLALSDARTQGKMFVNFVAWRRGLRKHLNGVELK